MSYFKVLFFRGLNTYATDNVRVGPIDLGPAHAQLQQSFRDHGVELIPILEFGFGSLEDQVQRAISYSLKNNLIHENDSIHLLGHSTGGLVARGFAQHHPLCKNIMSISTLATPHHGSQSALKALEVLNKSAIKKRFYKKLGYDLSTRVASFTALTPHSVELFNQQNQIPDHITKACITFSIDKSQLSGFLKLGHFFLKSMSPQGEENDGLVELSTQRWGKHLGHYKLDHFGQLGINLYLKDFKKQLFGESFDQMVEDLVEFWSNQRPIKNKKAA